MRILLIKRLSRSMWKTKLRLFTVIALISMSIWAGASMIEHTKNLDLIYDDFYDETNLADIFVDIPGNFSDVEDLDSVCMDFSNLYELNDCNTQLVVQGTTIFEEAGESNFIPSILYGFDQATVSKPLIESGRFPSNSEEITLDAHILGDDGVDFEINDIVSIQTGDGIQNLTIVGFANHPHHLFYAPEGSIFPTYDGLVIAYTDVDYLVEIGNFTHNSRNQILVDLSQDIGYDLRDTPNDEGREMSLVKQNLSDILVENGIEQGLVNDRGGITSVEFLRQDLEGSKKSTPIIVGVLLGVAGFVIAISLDRLVKSQQREIAVLKTLGISAKELIEAYLLLPIVLGLTGGGLGILFGISPYGSQFITEYYASFLKIPIIEVHHYPRELAVLFTATLAVTLIFGIRPAIKASRMEPLDVMGQDASRVPPAIIAKLTNWMPPSLGFGMRSTFKRPARLLMTLIALSLSMVILGGMMILTAGIDELFTSSIDEVENWDLEATNYDLAEIEQWAIDKEADYEYVLRWQARIVDDERDFQILGIDEVGNSGDEMHSVSLQEGKLPQEGMSPVQVLIDEGMSAQLGLKPGDNTSIAIGAQELEVEVTGISREMVRVMTLHRSDITDYTFTEATSIWLSSPEGLVADDVLIEASLSVDSLEERKQLYNELLNLQKQNMQVIYFIGGLMAVAVLFNTLLINLSERDTELATLRVLGASKIKLAIILTVEHSIIGLLGGIAGLFASRGMAMVLTTEFSTWSFHVPFIASRGTELAIIGIIFGISALITPLGIYRLHKMNLLKVVAEHER